jgi:neutral ceramidase
MALSLRAAIVLGTLALIGGCANRTPFALPAPISPAPNAALHRSLSAGFGRADITPPPVGGVTGYGPEGRPSQGYRHRVYARAMLLEDEGGERLAIVTLDLPFVSPFIHRSVAEWAQTPLRIGADRLILSATHSHSGSGHFMAVRPYDEQAAAISGFDPAMAEFLIARIDSALSRASRDLRPARAAWAMDSVWKRTRIRSLEAYERNDPKFKSRWTPPPDLTHNESLIDPTWTMLRIDQLDAVSGRYRPAAAFSIFAIHGTGNSNGNALFDGDIHALMERGLEAHIDSLRGVERGFAPASVHLVAQSAEGDVSPNFTPETRCPVPRLRRLRRPAGPRSPPAPEGYVDAPPDEMGTCLRKGRELIAKLGDELTGRAIAIFDGLSRTMTRESAGRVRIARVFEAVDLTDQTQANAACPVPRNGTASAVGGEDGYTRLLDWKMLGFIAMGFEEGGSAVGKKSRDCHRPKRVLLGRAQTIVAGKFGLPRVAHLTVVRIGGVVIGTVPAEVTTTAASRMRDAMLRGARRTGAHPDSVVLVGLTNGYMHYVTTPEEYEVQHYEGASTIHGPNSSVTLAHALERLAGLMPAVGRPSPPADVPALTAYPGVRKRILPSRETGPALVRRAVTAAWKNDTLVVRWLDVYPGRLVPADGAVLAIQARTAAGWRTVAWDDDRDLEVRAVKPAGRRGFHWEAKWSGRRDATQYRVVLLRRGELEEISVSP